jgi:acyl-coenzyme A thioesterase PaaI-like protein
MKEILQEAFKALPPAMRATALLRGFGFLKVPLLNSVKPQVQDISDRRVVVSIPLRRWTKNHLGSMYFGSLAIGADCVVGLMAMHHIQKRGGGKVHLSFKDFKANFLKRPEEDVLFVCEEGERVARLVEKVLASGERENLTVNAYASVKSRPLEPVAEFQLTLSLKKKS